VGRVEEHALLEQFKRDHSIYSFQSNAFQDYSLGSWFDHPRLSPPGSLLLDFSWTALVGKDGNALSI
jgi:hypothetical protein